MSECEKCEGTGYICSQCGQSVSVDGTGAASACRCPFNGGRQPAVKQCDCQIPKPAKKRSVKK